MGEARHMDSTTSLPRRQVHLKHAVTIAPWQFYLQFDEPIAVHVERTV